MLVLLSYFTLSVKINLSGKFSFLLFTSKINRSKQRTEQSVKFFQVDSLKSTLKSSAHRIVKNRKNIFLYIKL